MDINQIDNISRNNPVTKHTYIGCFAENKMPIKPENGYMIVNNESDPSKMGHWILIYKNNDNIIFLTRSDSIQLSTEEILHPIVIPITIYNYY